MKLLILCFVVFIFLHFACTYDLTAKMCEIKCTPDDENTENNLYFENFIETLYQFLLFEDGPSATCKTSDEKIQLSPNDDFVWELIKELYDRRQNDDYTENTLNDCYCQFNQDESQCKSEEYQTCLQKVREAMTDELFSFFYTKVQEKVDQMAENC